MCCVYVNTYCTVTVSSVKLLSDPSHVCDGNYLKLCTCIVGMCGFLYVCQHVLPFLLNWYSVIISHLLHTTFLQLLVSVCYNAKGIKVTHIALNSEN